MRAVGAVIEQHEPIDLHSARRAFGYLDFKDPRILALPLELGLSASGIAGETLLRMLAVSSVVGPERLPVFMHNAASPCLVRP